MNVSFYLSYDIKNTLKSHLWRKKVIISPLCMQRCCGRHNFFRTSIFLLILLHEVISLPNTTSYDNGAQFTLFEIGIELTTILYEVIDFERELCSERFPSVLSK